MTCLTEEQLLDAERFADNDTARALVDEVKAMRALLATPMVCGFDTQRTWPLKGMRDAQCALEKRLKSLLESGKLGGTMGGGEP